MVQALSATARSHPDQMLTEQEVAALLKVHPRTVRGFRERRLLHAVKLGHRTIRYRASEVDELVNQHTLGGGVVS
jgi:excisionase family DNA binding protein